MDHKINSSLIRQYLADHEDDIAMSINDYGDLHNAFVAIFNRKPSAEWVISVIPGDGALQKAKHPNPEK
jgi:hypothetical protein